jgi:NAD(P)-dependent dehydrogenase (short-subunit alcohol dehydrogenase family)
MADKAALILGASRGLGLGLAEEFAGRGYAVYATQRSHSEELAGAVKRSKGAIHVRDADVTNEKQVEALAGSIKPASLDVLVLNAGAYGPDDQSIAAMGREDVADIMMTNAIGPAKAAVTLMPLLKDGGRLVMMTSKMGSIADSSGGVNHYRISKVAQNMLARSLFEQHAKERGIPVLSLHPGWVQTAMGGPNALINVETSVRGMADLIEEERRPEHVFLAYDGKTVPW